MAVTISQYNQTSKLLLNKEVNFANMKVELLNATATFVATHSLKTNVDNAGAYEVSGNGWATGGQSIPGAAVTTVDTNDAMLDATDVDIVASGGSIGPAYGAFIYETDNNKCLWFIDFGQAETAGDTTQFKIIWHANGIVRVILS